MKIVINDPETGKSFQRELEEGKSSLVIGKKIGSTLEGGAVGLPGYTLKITGGSDSDGTPMRFDVPGTRRVLAVLSAGPGVKHLKRGNKLRKRVAGNSVSDRTAQLNVKIEKKGEKQLSDLGFVPKQKEEKNSEAAKS
ncbi:30S ribosomal protein S6e [Candidatus Micrarchaeota archaeon]|nr:30S ribosomal protein S6e [Candidatus Micrarchaeota archaeon]